MASSSPLMSASLSPVLPVLCTPHTQRIISPSAQLASSAKRAVLITHSPKLPSTSPISVAGLSVRGSDFPLGLAYVGHPHAHPSRTEHDERNPPIYHSRHIILPFSLRDPSLKITHKEISPFLENIFPDLIEVGQNIGGLYFHLKTLPPKPWPLTVGGLPIKMFTDIEGRWSIFPRFPPGQGPEACKDFTLGREEQLTWTHLEKIGTALVQHLSKENPDVQVSEILAPEGQIFYIVLCNGIDILTHQHTLPRKIAGHFAQYLLDQDICRPAYASDLLARRIVLPNPSTQIVDNTAYDILRPGIMVYSPEGADWIQTTAGVLVHDKDGNQFITGASHSIGNVGKICYPRSGPEHTSILGESILEVPYTDIALVKLHDHVRFHNQTFDDPNGITPIFSRLSGERVDDNTIDIKLGTPVSMNNPWTGYLDSVMVGFSVRIVEPKCRDKEDLKWIRYNWAFPGDDGSAQPPPSACGSAIWDENGVVVGFHRFHITEGKFAGTCVSVSASHLVNFGQGYGLVV